MSTSSAFKMPSNPFLRFITFSLIFAITAICIFTFVQWHTENNANNFCNSVKIGSTIDGLIKSATDHGARVPKKGWSSGHTFSKTLFAKFTGIDPMYGYSCTITASNDIVTSKELVLIDP